MGMNTAIKNGQILENACGVLGIELMAAAQALDFRPFTPGRGVGAARLLTGMVLTVQPTEVTAIVNVGDDTVLHGLAISPDLYCRDAHGAPDDVAAKVRADGGAPDARVERSRPPTPPRHWRLARRRRSP